MELQAVPTEGAIQSSILKIAPTRKGRYRILMAEDDIHTQQFLTRLLKSRGIDVTVVDNGLACVDLALEAWKNDEAFDGILLHIQMPYLRGYDVVANLRDEGYPGVIIAMTAYSYVHDPKRALSGGFDAYLEKPFGVGSFLSILTKKLNRSEHPNIHIEKVGHPQKERSPRYNDIVVKFRLNLPERLRALKAAYESENLAELEHLAHRLSTAELMGYPSLGQIGRDIEKTAHDGRKDLLSALMVQLEECVRHILSEKG